MSSAAPVDAVPAEEAGSPLLELKSASRLITPSTMPFDYAQKEIIVRGRIEDSEEVLLLFDTGSSETIVDRRLAAQLFLTKGADFKIETLASDVSAQTTKINRLTLGNLIIHDVDARLLDLTPQSRQLGKPIAGIIGMNVISNYLVTINYSKPAITFADTMTSVRPANCNVVSFDQANAPIVTIKLGLDDRQELLMDTGAAFNHLSQTVAERYLSKDKSQARHFTEGTGLDGRPVRLGVVIIDPVSIGSQSLHKVSFTYPANTDTTKSGAIKPISQSMDQKELAGILGNPFWQNFIVTIDARFMRIFLKTNTVGAQRSEIGNAVIAGDLALATRRDFKAAELSYNKSLSLAQKAQDLRYQAIVQGRLGNLRRVMVHDLARPEHAASSYSYFARAQELARKADLKDVEGRILADWSLLYSDNGQPVEAKQTIDKALMLAPEDATVNLDYAVHLFRNSQYLEAQKYIEKALFLDPSNWQALWYQVKLSETFADLKKEKETLTQIVKRYSWSKVAAEKLKELTTAGKQN